MIQLLLSTVVDVYTIRDAENGLTFQASTVTELENGWLLLINEPDDWDDIETAIEAIDDVQVIGSYNEDGTQYIYGNPNRNHTIEKYHGKLKPKKVFNEQTQQFDDVPYTLGEAVDVQVNKVYGWNNRTL